MTLGSTTTPSSPFERYRVQWACFLNQSSTLSMTGPAIYSIMYERSSQKALRIRVILDGVVWLVHAGGCSPLRCLPPVGIHHYCNSTEGHLRNLLACILVCKFWAEISIPQLWSSYAHDRDLFALLADIPHAYGRESYDSRPDEYEDSVRASLPSFQPDYANLF
jgi:hypothetical protein